jgi:hypothetical protein
MHKRTSGIAAETGALARVGVIASTTRYATHRPSAGRLDDRWVRFPGVVDYRGAGPLGTGSTANIAGRAAVPAVGGAATVNGAAGAALTVHAILRSGEQALELLELGVGLLQLGGAAGEHVEAIVVADRHFVGEPAEIQGQRGDTLGQLVAAAAQLGRGWRERVHQPPVSIGWAPRELTSSSCFLPVLEPSFLSLVGVTLTALGGGVFSIALAS